MAVTEQVCASDVRAFDLLNLMLTPLGLLCSKHYLAARLGHPIFDDVMFFGGYIRTVPP